MKKRGKDLEKLKSDSVTTVVPTLLLMNWLISVHLMKNIVTTNQQAIIETLENAILSLIGFSFIE